MNRRAWSSRILLRYVLLQLPALTLLILMLALVQRWVSLPAWFTWGLIALWIAKDVILFPLTWRAYDRSHKGAANSMIGLRGITEDRLAPSGYVRVHGELWKAEAMENSPPIEKGESVRVHGNRGLTLIVQCDNKESNGGSNRSGK
jgi:membrane protein implicated in regulation of membrane protease activity